MVESKLVELVVAGSNPVGHPIFASGENAASQRSEDGLFLQINLYEPAGIKPLISSESVLTSANNQVER